jgi:hypothetical protein
LILFSSEKLGKLEIYWLYYQPGSEFPAKGAKGRKERKGIGYAVGGKEALREI